MKKVFILMIVVLLSFGTTCKKTDNLDIEIPSVSLSILTEGPFTVGDRIDIALSVYHGKAGSITFPKQKESFAPLVLKEISITKKRSKRAVYKTIVLYTLASYRTGDITLNPLEVSIGTTLLKTEPLAFSILSVLPKDEKDLKIKDIKQPYLAKLRPVAIIAPLLALIIGIPLFLFLIKFIFRRQQSRQAPSFEGANIDPFQFSLAELENIKRAHIENRTNSKQIYSRLSFILRFYIGSLLNIAAPQMTTNELRRYIKRQKLFYLTSSGLMNLLARSDGVKFAKDKPRKTQVEKDIDESISIVKKTKDSLKETEKHDTTEKRGEYPSMEFKNGV